MAKLDQAVSKIVKTASEFLLDILSFCLIKDHDPGDIGDQKDFLLNYGGTVFENIDRLILECRAEGINSVPSLRKTLLSLFHDILEVLDKNRNCDDLKFPLRNFFAKVRDSIAVFVSFCSNKEVDIELQSDIFELLSTLEDVGKSKKPLEEGCFTYASRLTKLVKEEISEFEKELIVMRNPGRNITFCLSQKNRTLMLLDGFLLRIAWIGRESFRWCCRFENCKYRVSTSSGTIKESAVDHNHEIDKNQFTKNLLRSRIKSKAYESLGTPLSVIIQEEIAVENYEDLHLHGTSGSLKTMGRRIRRQNLPQFSTMRNISHLNISPEMFFEDSSKKESLLLYDNKKAGGRVLVLGKKSHLRILCESPIWLGDGTFKASPRVGSQTFGQLYTLAGSMKDKLFILLRVLMERRRKAYSTHISSFLIVDHNSVF